MFLKLFLVTSLFMNIFAEDIIFEEYLGSKTPYRKIANENCDEIKYEGCEPLKLWLLLRHGVRNPKKEVLSKMKNRLPIIRDLIVNSKNIPNNFVNNNDLEAFKNWKCELEEENIKTITTEGKEELLLLGQRMAKRLPKVLVKPYSNTTYKFQYTDWERTKNSAIQFAKGLFGDDGANDVWFPTAIRKDPILRFYKLCKKWKFEVKKSPQKELIKFQQSKYLNNTLKNINERLGIDELNLDDIHNIYLTCSLETAWHKNKRSPWCSVFSIEDFKILEYEDDLYYYWIDAYGNEINYKQACPLLTDMVKFVKSDNEPKVTVYISHSSSLLKFLALFGLYKDERALTAENFEENDNRKLRARNISGFGSNLGFVVFKCGEDKKLLTLHQERVIRLPVCPDTDLCDFNLIQNHYSQYIDCNFNILCNVNKTY